VVCEKCKGMGFVKTNKGGRIRVLSCSYCRGKQVSKIDHSKCPYCGGLGIIPSCCGEPTMECEFCKK
jgi:DnaJ-class molecular chaperone